MTTPASRTSDHGRLLTLWSLRPGTHLESGDSGDDVLLHHRWGVERIERPGRVVREALRRMSFGPVQLANVPGAADTDELTVLVDRIRPLLECGLQFEDGTTPLLGLVAMSPRAESLPVEGAAGMLGPQTPVRLSRFTSLRSTDDGFVMESPLSLYRARLDDGRAVALIGAVGRATTAEAAAGATGLGLDAVRRVLGLLVAAGLIDVARSAHEPFGEELDDALTAWVPVDLLFHTRSTLGRHDHDFGAVRHRTGRDHARARPDETGQHRVALPRPPQRTGAGPALADLLERARERREFGARGPSRSQLAELLFHAARADSGSCCPLELYLSVTQCADLTPGIYRYDRDDHSLVLVTSDDDALHEVLEHAAVGARLTRTPAVLVTLTARFDQVDTKLAGPGYALVLRSAGAAVQTMGLVAATLGLAIAPLTMLDIDADARLLGLDWRIESTVAATVVGVAADEEAESA
ncbi:SagB/ThcOx family dehydrogenase [Streptomyces sp. SID8379]|uniref:SagB family peptide dehydrogenase n=1 Tax=unclassified Streptomyces TaxID=2593676 RepID=UPI0003818345|nr:MULTISPECIES: SagB family peptide dehydrogenase [unclassified Streptomyces]MYW65871.1 SagB/ThcOx family dehydrogenase [Streptomyces sp. SID8379]